MSPDQIEQLAGRLEATPCPVCGHHALRADQLTRRGCRGRGKVHALRVTCVHCDATYRINGLPGWRNDRALSTILTEFKAQRDMKVAGVLMEEEGWSTEGKADGWRYKRGQNR